MEATIVYSGNVGITENKMETTVVCWGLMSARRESAGQVLTYRESIP